MGAFRLQGFDLLRQGASLSACPCRQGCSFCSLLQSNLGTVSQNYQLSDQPKFGEWTIQVIAQGQIEEYSFVVEEYYQTRFEVNSCND